MEKRDFPNRSHYPEGISGNLFGRPKKNASEADKIIALRGAVAGLIRCGSRQFAQDIQSLKPKDRLNLLMQMLRLVLPKPRPMPLSEDDGEVTDSVADLLRTVYGRQQSALVDETEDDGGGSPETVNGLLSRVRSQMPCDDEDDFSEIEDD